MKQLRLLAAILLVLDGFLHIFLHFATPIADRNMGTLVFGILYTVVGASLFNKKMYPIYLGILVPSIGMTLSIVKFGIPNTLSLSALFKVVGLVAILCCISISMNLRRMIEEI